MKTREITLSALMIAILAICSQLSIPIGPIPITMQTFAVLLIGMILPSKHAFVVTSAYLLLGLIGFPVFANGSGGLQSFLSPAFGFAIGFIPAASLMARFLEKKSQRTLTNYLIASLLATLILYTIGLGYMSFILNVVLGAQMTLPQVLMAGMLPFLPGDILKAVFSAILAQRLHSPLQAGFRPST